MARARKTVRRVTPSRATRTYKVDHGINIGLLVTVIVVVLVASVWISYTLINRPLESTASSENTPANYSSTYQLDDTMK